MAMAQALSRREAPMGGSTKVRLVPLDEGPTIELRDGIVLVGRSPAEGISVPHVSVSTVHAALAPAGARIAFHDLGSRNGTWLNGVRRVCGHARVGDTLAFAAVRFCVELVDGQKPNPPDSLPRSHPQIAIERGDLVVDDWAPGLEIFDGCRLKEPLSHGGFGEVWSAERTGFGVIAVKRVRLQDSLEHEKRALKALRGLKHRYLLRMFGGRVADNVLVAAMELADESLESCFHRYRRQGLPGIPQNELLRYTRHIAQALDFLYLARKLLHRDVKPGNILRVGRRAKLGDIGLAKVLEEDIGFHSGVASFDFAPPEFFDGKMVASSDQFSLASTYCYLLTGDNPFPGRDVRQIALSHVIGEPKLERVPETQRPTLVRALSRDPKKRWPNCSTFVKELLNATLADPHRTPT